MALSGPNLNDVNIFIHFVTEGNGYLKQQSFYQWLCSLKTEKFRDAKFTIIGDTDGCQHDNHWCH